MMSIESAWVKLVPSRHFVAAEKCARRCGMCHRLIEAGERYYASRYIDYSGVIRFHATCAEKYAKTIFL